MRVRIPSSALAGPAMSVSPVMKGPMGDVSRRPVMLLGVTGNTVGSEPTVLGSNPREAASSLCSPSGEAADLGSASFAGSTPVTSTCGLAVSSPKQKLHKGSLV
jgi:hypothetical protein